MAEGNERFGGCQGWAFRLKQKQDQGGPGYGQQTPGLCRLGNTGIDYFKKDLWKRCEESQGLKNYAE